MLKAAVLLKQRLVASNKFRVLIKKCIKMQRNEYVKLGSMKYMQRQIGGLESCIPSVKSGAPEKGFIRVAR